MDSRIIYLFLKYTICPILAGQEPVIIYINIRHRPLWFSLLGFNNIVRHLGIQNINYTDLSILPLFFLYVSFGILNKCYATTQSNKIKQILSNRNVQPFPTKEMVPIPGRFGMINLVFWSACLKPEKWAVMYLCVRGIRKVSGHVFVC